MCTAHLPTINALVATRCQYRWGGCPQVNKRSLEIVPINVFSVLELCYEDVKTEWFLPCFYVVDKVVTRHWSTINLAYCAVNIEIYSSYREYFLFRMYSNVALLLCQGDSRFFRELKIGGIVQYHKDQFPICCIF